MLKTRLRVPEPLEPRIPLQGRPFVKGTKSLVLLDFGCCLHTSHHGRDPVSTLTPTAPRSSPSTFTGISPRPGALLRRLSPVQGTLWSTFYCLQPCLSPLTCAWGPGIQPDLELTWPAHAHPPPQWSPDTSGSRQGSVVSDLTEKPQWPPYASWPALGVRTTTPSSLAEDTLCESG